MQPAPRIPSPAQGRPPSRLLPGACRAAYKRDSEKLLQVEERIRQHFAATTTPDEAAWERARAHVRWALQHYGAEAPPETDGAVGLQGMLAGSKARAEKLPETLPPALRCLNPKCANLCSHRTGKQDRQPLFCSNKCGDDYRRDRERLIRYWGELAWSYQFTGLPYPLERIEQAARRIEWLLIAYGVENVRERAQASQPPAELQEARQELENLRLPLFPSRRTRPPTAHEAEAIQRVDRLNSIWLANRKTSRRL